MRVAMIGSGYVGLVSGACFADFGHVVTCVDKDASKIAALQRGEMPIFEPGLDELVADNVEARRLAFTLDLAKAVSEADAVFIAVGTPSRRGDGHADLTYVYEAAREIAHALDGYTVIVTKSTVPVGTGDEVERIVREDAAGRRIRARLQSRIPARGCGDQRFQAAGPHRHRDRGRKSARSDDRALSPALSQRATDGGHVEADRRAHQIRRRTHFSRPRSPSSTRSPICARRSAPMCRRWRAASASTTASAGSSCMPDRATAAPAFPRTRWR